MKSARSIILILLLVLSIAVIIQIVRSETLFKRERNGAMLENPFRNGMMTAISDDGRNRKERDRYCIIIDSEDKNSIELKNQTAQVLKNMKKDFEVLDVAYSQEVPTDFGAFVICVRHLDRIKGINEIFGLVQAGGKAFFAASPEEDGTFHRFYRKLGIVEMGGITELSGIKLLSGVMIKGRGMVIEGDFIKNISIAASLDSNCTLHASAELFPYGQKNEKQNSSYGQQCYYYHFIG